MTALTHPRLAEIAAYLATVRADLASVVEPAPAAALRRRPRDGGWSGAQILQHLGKTEGSIAKMLERAFAAAPDLPAETDTSSLATALDRYAVDVAERKLVAPAGIQPDADPDPVACWASLQAARERTYRAFAAVDGRAIGRISAPHPYFGPLNAYEWFLLLGKHEARHLRQLTVALAQP
jgi:uncharacterized damage-inducible protein DinB